jgi:GrpB-like predicted nucleotidyltransferase (UPF0157 family)
MTRKRNYKIIPYNSKWPILFSQNSEKIKDIIGDNILETHHIGSTSVVGMSGKSTIDILFIVKDISKISEKINVMEKIGYNSLGALNTKNSYLFEKEKNGNRTLIAHFYKENHPEIKQILAIRDYLRNHKDEVKKYSEIKLSFFQKFPNDYSQYRKLKDEYMKDLKERVIFWSKGRVYKSKK